MTTTLALRIPLATSLSGKSGPLEEVSLRGNMALNQTKVYQDYLVSTGEEDADALEEQYVQMSAQVDKVTLKLFMQIVQSGKVERGLDLVERLHLEKSYDIAVKAADRIGQRKLSDRIEERKMLKFAPPPEEEEEMEEDGFDGGSDASDFEDDGSVVATREERQRRLQQPPSPPPPSRQSTTPRSKRRRDVTVSDGTEEESPPKGTSRRKTTDNADDDRRASTSSSANRRLNPFAKKRLESPARGMAPLPPSPTKVKLSRSSTFSTESRDKSRAGKQIM